jgi:hypothetical protein
MIPNTQEMISKSHNNIDDGEILHLTPQKFKKIAVQKHQKI